LCVDATPDHQNELHHYSHQQSPQHGTYQDASSDGRWVEINLLVSDVADIENDSSSKYLSTRDFGLFFILQFLFDYRFYDTHSPVLNIVVSRATQLSAGFFETKSRAS
jgi:hypothetical protein